MTTILNIPDFLDRRPKKKVKTEAKKKKRVKKKDGDLSKK